MILSDVRLLSEAYARRTPASIKTLDVFLLFSTLTGLVQMSCLAAMSPKPFQHFVGSLVSSLASFALTAHVRMRAAETLRAHGPKAVLVPVSVAVELVVANIAVHMFTACMLTSVY